MNDDDKTTLHNYENYIKHLVYNFNTVDRKFGRVSDNRHELESKFNRISNNILHRMKVGELHSRSHLSQIQKMRGAIETSA